MATSPETGHAPARAFHPSAAHRPGAAVRALRDDACGCAMGAASMAISLGMSTAYFGWQCWAHGMALSAAGWRVALITFLAAGAGKVVGILRHRLRRSRPATQALPLTLDPHPTGD